ncbi:MAG: CoA-binding domain protein, partial [Nocardioidaceae bacterium]|nr:CoA-binding domain protein [Nocardioidaceae bacterium]
YRIPPISALDASETVRAIKAAPLLFGYRGSEQVDVAAVEDLLRRVALLKNDLPQLAAVTLSLVHAGAEGVSVLSAEASVAPVSDVRYDWFVRRLAVHPGDSLHG